MNAPRTSLNSRKGTRPAAFTTIELMIAIAIGALLMLTAIPAVQAIRKPPLVRAVNDLLEACRQARAQAILSGRAMQVVIHNGGSSIDVEPAPVLDPTALAFAHSPSAQGATPSVTFMNDLGSGNSVEATEGKPPTSIAGISMKPFSAAFAQGVAFEKLYVNLRNQMQEETAQIRFYPNGTCDQFDAVLTFERREFQHFVLEVLTGQPTVSAP